MTLRFEIFPPFDFWAHLCILHGGLICVTFCPSVSVTLPKFTLDNNSYLRNRYESETLDTDCQCQLQVACALVATLIDTGFVVEVWLMVGKGLVLWTGRAHCQRQVAFLSLKVSVIPKKGWADPTFFWYDTYSFSRDVAHVTMCIKQDMINKSFEGEMTKEMSKQLFFL